MLGGVVQGPRPGLPLPPRPPPPPAGFHENRTGMMSAVATRQREVTVAMATGWGGRRGRGGQ